jgi:putative RecB family exonuclease
MTSTLLTNDGLRSAQGGVFAYLSPSRLNCWIKCPRAFAYRYLERIKSPTTPGLFLGTAVHWALQVVYQHRQLGIRLEAGDVAKRLQESWGGMLEDQDMQFDSPAAEQALQQQAVDLITAYLAHVPADEPKPLAVETALQAPLVDPHTGEDLGIPLVGILDLVLDGHDGPLIADFKTSARSGEPLEIFHEIQLSSYAYLFRHVAQQPEAGLEIRSLIKTKQVKIEFHRYPARTDAHFRRLFAVIHDYLDALDSDRFNYRPGLGCSFCDYRRQCAGWAG